MDTLYKRFWLVAAPWKVNHCLGLSSLMHNCSVSLNGLKALEMAS